MATINVTIYQVLSGAYKDKYIAIAGSLNTSVTAPVEKIATDTFKVNLPDFNNRNTNGVVESVLLIVEDVVTIEDVQAYTQRLGLYAIGELQVYQNTNMLLISDDLESSLVTAVFFGAMAQNYLNGSKYCLYELGAAEDIYTIS